MYSFKKPLLSLLISSCFLSQAAFATNTFSSVNYEGTTYNCCSNSSMTGKLQWVKSGGKCTASSSCTAATLLTSTATLSSGYFSGLYLGSLSNGHPEGFSTYQIYLPYGSTGLVAEGVYYWSGCSSTSTGSSVGGSAITCTNN